ncbi:MFS transporter [Cognatishimia sp.]|uniref:MFS transporter n=1 Tax=Cognatishimia sp. TaxID=2211648 RepID=UPI00351324A6
MGFIRFLIENARWLAAGALLTFMSGFGQTFFISIFAGEIRAEFGLSHGEWGAIYAMGTTASAVVMVWAGALADRLRARVLGTAILTGSVAACLFMAANPYAALLPLVVFALRFTGQGMSSHLGIVIMSRWFAKMRGRAIATATFGFSIAEVILPISFVLLMGWLDWRLLWVAAAIIAALGIPVLRHLLKSERSPGELAASSENAGLKGLHWTRGDALRHWLFWLLMPAIVGLSAFGTAFFFHQVHFAEMKGLTHLSLVSSFPFFTAVTVASMATFGWALDRFGVTRLLPLYVLPMCIAFVCFALASGLPMIWLGLLFFGITAGASSTLVPAFWTEVYGTRHIGSIKAIAAAAMVFGSAIGPGLTGTLIDLGLALEAQYFGVAAYFALVTLAQWRGVARLTSDA